MATVHAPSPVSTTPFKNEPMSDFSRPDNARRMREAIESVRNQLGREYDLVIGGRRSKTARKDQSINPARPSEVVGLHQHAGPEQVQPAMDTALRAFERWRWYVARARSMPPRELPHRAREWSLRRSGRRLNVRLPGDESYEFLVDLTG